MNLIEMAVCFTMYNEDKKHFHNIEGINSRMDGLQAGILSIKLKYINEWNEKRIHHAKYYANKLKDYNNIITPQIYSKVNHGFHLYVIRLNNRDKIKNNLVQKGIGCGIHYPTPLPFLNAYKYLNHTKDDFPISWDYKSKILSLPMYPELKPEKMDDTSDE